VRSTNQVNLELLKLQKSPINPQSNPLPKKYWIPSYIAKPVKLLTSQTILLLISLSLLTWNILLSKDILQKAESIKQVDPGAANRNPPQEDIDPLND
jgi:hypothetical protein